MTSLQPIDIHCHAVQKQYPSGKEVITALEAVDTHIQPGEFVSLLGPSGCGKTTLLRLIAGLEFPTSGLLEIDGIEVVEPHPELGVVFQNDLLMPWRTVLDNVLLQAEVRGLRSKEYRRDAIQLLELVGLSEFADRYPSELSGGMRQRVGICRALLHKPRLLLMDEPFAALDAMTRDQIALDLAAIVARTGTTVVFVTHSIAEAVFLSDRILVMSPRPGKVAAEVSIDIPKPRSLRDRQEQQFVGYVGEVTEIFEQLGVLRDRVVPTERP